MARGEMDILNQCCIDGNQSQRVRMFLCIRQRINPMHFKFLRIIPFFVFIPILLFTPIEGATEARDEAIQFVHRERSLQPGEAVLLEIVSPQPLKEMKVRVFAREFPCFADDAGIRWTGLLGIDIETKPGRYPVKLTGIDRNRKPMGSQAVLVVVAKRFPTRRLTVEEKYVSPPPDALIRIKEERERVSAIFASVTPERFWHGSFALPVPGSVISVFGKRNIYNGQPRSPHTGVDFRGDIGTPIKAPNAGRIVLAEDLYYSGKTIIIDHGLGLYSYFGHMSAFTVNEGDHVKRHDVIGRIGSTGRATGPHLHWTIRLVETRIDPLSLAEILSGGKI
jgi:murein DD-endopeptidase MepM/ murein hydrolase activator NlpD